MRSGRKPADPVSKRKIASFRCRPWHEFLQEVAGKREMGAGRIPGSSRERAVSKVRAEFLVRGLREAGISMAAPARLCRLNHVSVQGAVAKAREGKFTGE